MTAAEEKAKQAWYDRKSQRMEKLLGKQHKIVLHAIVPYAVGGPLDLYYYPAGIAGTAVATKELSELPGDGSWNRVFESYELVMFTKQRLDLDLGQDKGRSFQPIHTRISETLNHIAPFSAQATLNPKNTCEFPKKMPKVGGRCLIFDGYPSSKPAKFGLLAVIEVFRSEMNYAMDIGGAQLLKRLKAKEHYPYSDLDRKPVA